MSDETALDQHSRGPAGGVFGRQLELAALDRFVEELGSRPGALLIEGEPGAGKTTLWRAAIAAARGRGYQVLACHPAEPEASMPFAGLGDLLGEAVALIGDALPEHQLRSLRVAVLLDSPAGAFPEIRTVAVAALALLRSLASAAPVLLAVDDYHWADAGTRGVIEYVLRRVRNEPIGFVATANATRLSTVPTTLDPDLVERAPARVVAGPLDATALDELIRARTGTGFSLPALQEIALASGGNPLFALEIARALEAGEVEWRPGEPLAVPRTLEHLVMRRFDELPHDLQEMLVIAAAVADPTVALVAEVSDDRRARARLESAAASGIVTLSGDVIRFTHPLFASVLYHRVPTARRQLLHQRLASAVTTTAERARHLALGAVGPDATVAAALDDAAREAAARGDRATAARLSDDAARLTPRNDPASRERRRLLAADEAFAAGDARRARAILEELAITAEAGPHRADLLRRLAEVRHRSDSVAIAANLLTRAAAEAGPDGALRARIERDLAWAVSLCGDVRDAADHARLALDLARRQGDERLAREIEAASALTDCLLGSRFDASGVVADGGDTRGDATTPVEWRPRAIRAVLRKWSDDLPGAAAELEELHQAALASGDEHSLPFLLAQLGEVAVLRGELDQGLRYGRESTALARQMGQDAVLATALHTVALAQAHLGLLDDARVTAGAALEVAQAAGSVISMMLAQAVLGMVELSAGEAAAAAQLLRPLLAWAEVVAIREPGAVRFVPDAVEALVATGALDAADQALRPLEADVERLDRPSARLAAARARGIHAAATGDVTRGIDHLQRALERDAVRAQPLEVARTRLAMGAMLRRTRRRKVAIETLQAARGGFEAVGARAWALRASSLLGGSPSGHDHDGSPLTPAEHRVASLVAHGHTNREVAAQLFVSVRAVEVHLTSIYRKLRISSRTQLAARLAPGSSAAGEDDLRGPGEGTREAASTLPSPREPLR